jgi:transposase
MAGRKKSDWYVIQGKTVKEWADHFGVTIMSVYLWIKKGTLKSRIKGTYVPSYPRRVSGMTYKELSKKFNVTVDTIARWGREGTLERRIAGENIPRKTGKPAADLIDGMNYHDLAEKLGGVSRQRVFQLKKKGFLRDRLNGVDLRAVGIKRFSESVQKKYRDILAQRQFGESITDLALRFGVCASPLYRVAGKRVQFGAERMLLRYRKKVAEL